MKVLANTPDRLILERRPWILAISILLFTLVFVAIGLSQVASGQILGSLAFGLGGGLVGFIGFWAFVRRTQVILDRGYGTVTIRRRSLFGFTQEVYPLDEVTGAEVETSSGGDTDTHRPALALDGQTGPRRVPLVQVYVSGRSAERVVATIQDWLGNGPDA